MQSDSGRTTSIWMATANMPEYPPLREDTEGDVCVIGAGIAGMTTAYLLGRAGKRVVVVDDGPIGGGETGRTTAHLSNAFDDRYYELEKVHGEETARLTAESHTAAINRIELIANKEGIDCDLERLDGYLFVPPGESTEDLDRELEAAHRAGLADVTKIRRAPIDSFDTGPCLRFPRQGQLHALKYLAGLARAIERDGGRIYSGTHIEDIEGRPRRPRVTSGDKKTVTANAVVVATNSPISDFVVLHTKQAPYRTYVIGARVPRGSVPTVLLWDTLDPYHYVRLQHVDNARGRYDILIVGGEDHKTGQKDDADERFRCLEEWTRGRFPASEEIEFRWSGQVMEPVDHLAFIGPDPNDQPNLYIATGDSGQGMTHGTIAGILLTDLIAGKHNPWAKIYDPNRITLDVHTAVEFAKENLNVAAQYRDYVTRGDVRSPDEIPPGTGAVMRRGAKKVAVYRDERGTIHERSAVCTHLKCIVDWNSAEKTWDCPCHGSRFDAYGKVVNGPASADLAEVEGSEPGTGDRG